MIFMGNIRKIKHKTKEKKHLWQYGLPGLLIGMVLGFMLYFFFSPQITAFLPESSGTFIHSTSNARILINETGEGLGLIKNDLLIQYEISASQIDTIYGISDNDKYLNDFKDVASKNGGSRTFEHIQGELELDYGYTENDSNLFLGIYPATQYLLIYPVNLLSERIIFPEILYSEEFLGNPLTKNVVLNTKADMMIFNFLIYLDFEWEYAGVIHEFSNIIPIFPYLNIEDLDFDWGDVDSLETFMAELSEDLMIHYQSIILTGETITWDLREINFNWDKTDNSYEFLNLVYDVNGIELTFDPGELLELLL